MLSPFVRRLVDAAAAFYELTPTIFANITYTAGEVLEAQVLQESSGNPFAKRYEKALDARSVPQGDTTGVDDENFEDDSSFGLMQVLGKVFRARLGVPRLLRVDYSILYDPMVGLAIGCMELRDWRHRLAKSRPNLTAQELTCASLACYNMGGAGADPVDGGRIRNEAYVTAVLSRLPAVRRSRESVAWRTNG